MAEVLLQILADNLSSLIHREVGFIWGAEKHMEKLSSLLSTIRDVLEDAEMKQFTDKPIGNWLRKLKDAAYDASDALDDWSIHAQQPESELTNTGCIKQVVSSSVLCSLNFMRNKFRRDMGKRFKEITSTFDEISAERSKFHLNSEPVQSSVQSHQNRETSSTLTEPNIYGRDGDKKNMIDILMNNVNHEEENVSVFPIVGMGGIGKTILAQLVYNDEKVVNCFEVRIWVSVSYPFDVKMILKAIIEYFTKEPCELKNLESIQSKIADILMGERYLLVLDDMWNETRDEWNKLVSVLKCGAKGSSVILTTRSKIVASITGTAPEYCLEALSDEDCWSLFKKRAFRDTSYEQPNLVQIGKEIVGKCKGVPLAAKSLGSLLWLKTGETQWKLVRDSEIWRLEENAENTILLALRLSYYHLPTLLRQCFALCSIYPKDYEMKKQNLIYLWIANGYIQSDGTRELEDMGDEIFTELLRRSFLQDLKEDRFHVVTCKMHDLMHDLASSVMESESSILQASITMKVANKIRHLSLLLESQPSSSVPVQILESQPFLRSLVLFGKFPYHLDVSSLKRLRVLSLKFVNIDTFPPSISNLKHLKYLDLSSNPIKSLPESIQGLKSLQMLDLTYNVDLTTLPLSVGCLENLRYLSLCGCQSITSLPESIGDLRNLQSLILFKCSSLRALPERIGNMRNLKHLDTEGCTHLKFPDSIGKLTGLRKLDLLEVKKPVSDSGSGNLRVLQELNQLEGTLRIANLQNVRNVEDAKDANLGTKLYLSNLSLEWRYYDRLQVNNCKEVLESLQLPPNIHELIVNGYSGAENFPQEFFQNLRALKSLKIESCREVVCLPEGLQKLTSFERLYIWRCNRLKCLPVMGVQGLKNSLVKLEISFCDNLTSVSEGLRFLTSLQILDISYCGQLVFSDEDFQHLISLRQLSLGGLVKIAALPDRIQHLTVLQEMMVHNCKNLIMLPKELQNLTALQDLFIFGCNHDLFKRYEKEKGDEWHIISHIPKVEITPF